MISEETKKKILKCRNKERSIKKYYNNIYCEIIEWNNKYFLGNNFKWNQLLYNYFFSITEPIICNNEKCDKLVGFGRSFVNGYNQFCSQKCNVTSNKSLEKKKETSIKKYGVEHPMQSDTVKKKIENTNIEKYGVLNVFESDIIKKKIEEANIKKYGVSRPIQNHKIKEKIKKTNLKKYGVEYPSKLKKFEDKKIETTLKKYGVEHIFQSDFFLEKRKETNIEKYGVDNPAKSQIVKNKMIKTINQKTIDYWCDYLDIEDIDYDNEYLIIKKYCELHTEFKITLKQLYARTKIFKVENICTKCNPINEQSSIKENEVKLWLDTINVDYESKNRNILNGKEIDIYLPKDRLAIEFNGLYYHSDLFISNDYHLNKTEECEKQNIKLLHIFEDEWIFKKEIVKSIIKSKLGLIKERVYARKCVIKEISSNICNDFLNKNHIQGQVNSSIRLGLYYNDELVSLMTFGKSRVSLGSKNIDNGVYEMYRFCNRINTSVVGAASKLFKYFLENYKPKKVISFSDNRYFNGDLYKKLGFTYIEDTKPNYWYVKGLERYHRFNFRKDRLLLEGFDKSMTEKDIMIEKGYVRIYDCGNKKYELIVS